MKKLFAVLAIFVVCLSAQTAPAPSNDAASTDPNTIKARQILKTMIETLGGQAYLGYQSKTEEGRTYSFYQGTPKGSGTLYWRFWKYPDKERVEVTKQRDIAYLNIGEAGYEITYKGTAPQETEALEDYVRRRSHSMEIVLREWLNDPKTVVLLSGSGIAEQKLCDQVSIINGNNDSVTICVDQIDHVPVQKTFTYRDKDRYKVDEAEVFANYRVVQGVKTPFTFTRKKDGLMLSQRFITAVEYNVAIPDSKFDAHVTYDPYKLQHKEK